MPKGVNELTFIWTLTVARRTSTWEYIAITADNDLLISYDSQNTIPPTTVEQEVPLGGLTGRHTILARWNFADTPNSIYSAVDLFIES